jgi:hypothetical protein
VLLNEHKRDNVRLYDYFISLLLHLSIYTVLTTFLNGSPVVIPIITYSLRQPGFHYDIVCFIRGNKLLIK